MSITSKRLLKAKGRKHRKQQKPDKYSVGTAVPGRRSREESDWTSFLVETEELYAKTAVSERSQFL